MVSTDPTVSNPQHYRTVFENDRVRVLEYLDRPGEGTTPHGHPDSVMITMSAFDRRLIAADGREIDVRIEAGSARWLDQQDHSGLNIGVTDTHVMFVELKEPRLTEPTHEARLGPSDS